MAKTKKGSAPVSTRVVNGKVQLSKTRLAILADIEDVQERDKLRAKWEAKALASAEKNAAFQARREQYGLVVSDDNRFVYGNGMGGRRGNVFSKSGGQKLIADFEKFKALINGLND